MWTSANTKEEYIVKLKLDGLLDVEADEGKKQLKLNVDKEALCRAEELDRIFRAPKQVFYWKMRKLTLF